MKNGIKNIALASALVLTLGGGYVFASNSPSRAIVPLSPIISVAPIASTISQNVKEVQDATEKSDEGAQESTDDNITLPQGAITESTAKQVALSANAGTTVTAVETESQGGSIVYTISLSNGSDVKVEVTKGTIIKTELKWSEENDGKDKGIDSDKETADDAQDVGGEKYTEGTDDSK